MRLSVIIPCHNGAETIADQLEALTRQQWDKPWEIIVADNRSTDGSMAIVERYMERLPNLRIVDASERQGQPFALNTGVLAARGASVCFADADDVVGDGYVAAVGEALEKYEFIACRIDATLLNPPWVAESRGNFQRDGLQTYTKPPYLPHASGGTIGMRRDLFLAIGMCDEDLPYLHDTDLCWRIQLAGFKLHFVPEAVVHMRYRDTLRGMFKQTYNYAAYNVKIYKKYRRYGMPKLPLKDGIDGWWGVLIHLPWIRSRTDLAFWLRLFAWQYGRLRASLRYRVIAF